MTLKQYVNLDLHDTWRITCHSSIESARSSSGLPRGLFASVNQFVLKAGERSSSSTACCVLVSEVHGHGLVALSHKTKTTFQGLFGLIYENLH